MLRTLFMLVPLVASLVACGGSPPPPSYAGTARHRYEQGKEALDDEDYLQAVKHFTFVKNKFAYSKYAALAEVGMADAYFQQSKYIEAIDAFVHDDCARCRSKRTPNRARLARVGDVSRS